MTSFAIPSSWLRCKVLSWSRLQLTVASLPTDSDCKSVVAEPLRASSFRAQAEPERGTINGIVDPLEVEAQRKYSSRQVAILTRRHSPENIIFVRVLADYHAYIVLQAKKGFVAAARADMRALDAIQRPNAPELGAVYDTSALPAWALIHWFERRNVEAIRLLHRALTACSNLTTKFGHDYLTGKRIHLAANIARVLMSFGSHTQGLEYVAALRAVISGDRGHWPFDGGGSLDVPLERVELLGLMHQLARIESVHVDDYSCTKTGASIDTWKQR
jgi:hypothetical protein